MSCVLEFSGYVEAMLSYIPIIIALQTNHSTEFNAPSSLPPRNGNVKVSPLLPISKLSRECPQSAVASPSSSPSHTSPSLHPARSNSPPLKISSSNPLHSSSPNFGLSTAPCASSQRQAGLRWPRLSTSRMVGVRKEEEESTLRCSEQEVVYV